MKSDNLIVLFPGRNYSADMPLLYYAKFIYELHSYKVLCISYENSNLTDKLFKNYLADIKQIIYNQTSDFNFSKYANIIFVSKSIGTVLADMLCKIPIRADKLFNPPILSPMFYTHHIVTLAFLHLFHYKKHKSCFYSRCHASNAINNSSC